MRDKKKIYILLGTIILLTLILEIFFAEPHHHKPWNLIPGADIVIGFAGAWLLILLAKKIMAGLLQRKESYYSGSESGSYPKTDDLKDGGGEDA